MWRIANFSIAPVPQALARQSVGFFDRLAACHLAAFRSGGRSVANAIFFCIGLVVSLGLYGSSTHVVAATSSNATHASQYSLVMIEEDGCAYCLKWHQEVGPGYLRSNEGREAPLVIFNRRSDEARRFPRIVYTPTFILMRGDKELGRINGYPGADFFWSLLEDMLRKSDVKAMPASAVGR